MDNIDKMEKIKSLAGQISEDCIKCGLCQKDCAFLKKYGLPKDICDNLLLNNDDLNFSFECSLCGLCNAVCPKNLDTGALMLEIRRFAVKKGVGDFNEHNIIKGYEKKGASSLFSYYSFPDGCDTVFFPGCALPGTRPDATKKLFSILSQKIPNPGIVLDCCTKPSHDLGNQEKFSLYFNEMREYLISNKIKRVIVACPNCFKVFKGYGEGLDVKTVWEYLDKSINQNSSVRNGTVTVHDPCVMREESEIQQSIRNIILKQGYEIEEMKHSKSKTICCGEGGSVGFIAPELAKNWFDIRKKESGNKKIITYCAGCAHSLKSGGLDTSHVLDLCLEPDVTMQGKEKVASAPFTYLNRLKLKNYFKKTINYGVQRERPVLEKKDKTAIFKRLFIILMLVAIIAGVRSSGLTAYLEQEKLRALIEGYGVIAPIVYIAFYSMAPSLFLPGLPITIVGGALFGPIWGVVYAITGATIGATIAFLIGRYLGRSWVEKKLTSPRWKNLDIEVEKNGWKVVAFTRLIPIFPFNLLNYAFGLTKINLLHYVIASFIFMLPGCIAYVVFSSSFLDLIKGKITKEFFIGLVFVVALSLIPVFYKKFKKKDG